MLKPSWLSLTLFFAISAIHLHVYPQNPPGEDLTVRPSEWDLFERVEIPSSMDGKLQPAYTFWAEGESPRPLVVSLHTWSGDYKQPDSLARQCIQKNYNYIHPNFRGPNNQPEACGSPYVISDIEDAISYAIRQGHVDSSQIHVVGVSGGGYASLLTYMNTMHRVKTFSAWVPLSDLESWYYQSEGRGSRYAMDIANATVDSIQFTRDYYFLGKEEARKRSPLFMETPVDRRKQSKLYLYAGVHDGYTGSVPITQSLLFFNKVVKDFNADETENLIPLEDMLQLVSSRNFGTKTFGEIGGRTLYYDRGYQDLVRIRIFEGGHEMLHRVALDHIEANRCLIIGDSNGAAQNGWARQLEKMRFDDHFCNLSVAGNTIGFDNLGNARLNTLRNIETYLYRGLDELGAIDQIIIMLGSNDCKAVFHDSLGIVPVNLGNLIQAIRNFPDLQAHQPDIIIVSPPPYGRDAIMKEKYQGGADRIKWLQPRFRQVAVDHACTFIDVYSKLLPQWEQLSNDGIHLTAEGQQIIAGLIHEQLPLNTGNNPH